MPFMWKMLCMILIHNNDHFQRKHPYLKVLRLFFFFHRRLKVFHPEPRWWHHRGARRHSRWALERHCCPNSVPAFKARQCEAHHHRLHRCLIQSRIQYVYEIDLLFFCKKYHIDNIFEPQFMTESWVYDSWCKCQSCSHLLIRKQTQRIEWYSPYANRLLQPGENNIESPLISSAEWYQFQGIRLHWRDSILKFSSNGMFRFHSNRR